MDENNFIREKIKEKPINKRKVVYKIGISALCGLVFALVAGVIFAFVEPRAAALFIKEPETEVRTEETEATEIAEIVETETQMVETETTEEPEPVKYVLTLEDYQSIQTELYRIGTNANKSIVTVTGVMSNTDWFNNSYENTDQGSGVIISDAGTSIQILTERKNIQGATSISVSFIDETVATAELLSYDGNTGLAILSVQKGELTPETLSAIQVASIGNSAGVSNGDMVIALGSPLGTNYSILLGNITSRNNMITTTDCNYTIFTTDIVASKKGSGVLINTAGEIVGVVMQDYSNGNGETTLTAVSINELKSVMELLSMGKSIPYLGVEVTTVTEKIARENDIPKGVYVKDVEMDSPALLGGIQPGDIITEIHGDSVSSATMLNAKLLKCEPGEVIRMLVKRQTGADYNELNLEIEIGIK